MGQEYNHLSLYERQVIYRMHHLQLGNSIRKIAQFLNRSHSTISREIKRHLRTSFGDMYYCQVAHDEYKWNLSNKKRKEALKSNETRDYVEAKLKIGWTPELISGRLKQEVNIPNTNYESIYQFIYKQRPDLIEYLARGHKRRRKKYPTRKYKTKVLDKTSILERPDDINNRNSFGHWEGDTVESGGKKGGLNVMIERKSRLVRISKISSKYSDETQRVIEKKLSEFDPEFVKSITFDNGTENAKHKEIAKTLGADIYFCQPYHSWEKGAVEQVNGLIRRFYPKKTDFKKVHYKAIQKVENLLNNRPRKCLNFKTPNEVYNEISGALET
ncbi:MAG: IS30 family transposase [Saccharospirillaceae bacterium]|nr:IS30 family transposase [Saccharospirillaceae bacterium]